MALSFLISMMISFEMLLHILMEKMIQFWTNGMKLLFFSYHFNFRVIGVYCETTKIKRKTAFYILTGKKKSQNSRARTGSGLIW